jgi:Na+/melibiose symporter-like transporter
MICIILFVFSMSLWRAPAVALMPALTPPHLRSEGNAIINLMGGVGSVVGMVAGALVSAIYLLATGVNVTAENEQQTSFPYVFLLGAIVMIIGMLVVRAFVKEPSSKLEVAAAKNQALDEKAKYEAEKAAKKEEKKARKEQKLSKSERKSLVFMLGGLFFLFCGTNAITTFFALFASEVLGKTTSEATIMTTLFAVCSAAAAIPAGKMGKKLGRKKTILIGLVIFMAVFLMYVLTGSMALIWVALIFGGFANMLITVNTLPLVLDIGGIDKVGTFTGYYYTATFSAQIASPIIYGIVRMLSGTYLSLFVYSPIMFILSILFILFVKHGEAVPDDIVKKVAEEND